MYQKNIKQLTAAVLCAAMVMGQTPTVYAASEEDEFLIIEDSSEDTQPHDDEAFDEASDNESDEVLVDLEASDAASDEASEEDQEISSEDPSYNSITIEEENIEAESQEELLPEGVVGMPAGYTLTAEEKQFKEDLSAHMEVLDEFEGMVEGVDYLPDQVICVTDSQEHAEEIAAAYSGELESFEYGVAVIDLSNSEVDIATAYALAFDKDLNLPAVEPNYIYHLIEPIEAVDSYAPGEEAEEEESAVIGENDLSNVEAAKSWEDVYGHSVNGINFNDPFLNPANHYYQWHHDMVGTYEAWKVTTGGNYKVTVAVIDSGVQSDHPELSGRVTNGMGSGDGNGHGTHVAGIIAAAAGNGIGGSGIAPKANILSLQVLGSSGAATSDDIVLKALRYVAGINSNGSDSGNRRADIANLSLGGPVYDPNEQNAITLAYSRGVSIIAAMGNELSNHTSYPAAYKNVIAVGAVNETGSRAYFSCYGSWKDVSAPGTDITSSYPTGKTPSRYTAGKGYEVMDGTSQATPVVAGACALYMSYVGHVSPDAMLKALKASQSNGIINVGRLMKSAKPASTASYAVTGNKNVTSVKIQNASGNNAGYRLSQKKDSVTGATIYIGNSLTSITLKAVQTTKSGSAPTPYWTSSNPKVATVTNGNATTTVKAVSKGKATITCIARDGSGKKASVTLTVAQGVTEVRLTGQTVVTPGSKVSYKATAYPSNANFKTVTYKLAKAVTGVKVDAKTGKATIDKTAKGSFTVVAQSTDPGAKADSITVTIGNKKKADSVTISKPSTTTISTAAKGSLVKSVSLTATANNGAEILWKTSNEKVAKLSASRGKTVTVTAVKSGKVTITATASDGSGKKATISIKVVNPVASLHMVAKGGNSDFSVATGCSTTFKAVIGSTYGTPSNKKVNWTYEIYGRGNNGLEKLSSKAQEYCKKYNAFYTVNNSGKVTANESNTFANHVSEIKKYGANYKDYAVKVRATAADGSGSYDEKTIYKVTRNYAIRFYLLDNGGGRHFFDYFYANEGAVGGIYVYANYYELAVESSNPNVANAYMATVTLNDGSRTKILRVDCKHRGTCTIKVKAVDGSGVSGSFTFEVR